MSLTLVLFKDHTLTVCAQGLTMSPKDSGVLILGDRWAHYFSSLGRGWAGGFGKEVCASSEIN